MGNAATTPKRRPLPVHKDDVTAELHSALNKIHLTNPDSSSTENKQRILEESPEFQETLNYIGDMVKSMKSHKVADSDKNTMNLSVRKSLEDLYNFYFEYENKSHRQLIGDELVNTGAGVELYEYMRILTGNEKDYPLEDRYRYGCYEILRGICWNFSDVSPKLGQEFGTVGLLSVLLHDLQSFQHDFKDNKNKYFIVLSAMAILYNCARSGDNSKYFRAINAVDSVAWYAKHTLDMTDNVFAPLSSMTLAHIVDEKSNDVILADDIIIKTILQLLEQSLATPDHRSDGFSATELTNGLAKLSSNAENSIVIVKNGVLKSLARLLREGNEIEQTAAAKSIWVLTFVDSNKNTINAETEIVARLKSISAACSSLKLKQATNGALWMLKQSNLKISMNSMSSKSVFFSKKSKLKKIEQNEEKSEFRQQNTDDNTVQDELMNTQEQETTTSDSTSGHLMISYQWDCQKLMTKVKRHLEEKNYKVWMDLDQMGGSTLQSMADGVENSSAVFICISQKYKDSVSCRTEAEYAYKLGKTVIPIRIEKDYEPDGWLGAILGAKFYYDMSNLTMFQQVFSNLVKQLGDSGKIQKKLQNPEIRQHVTPVTKMSKKSRVKDWTTEDVKNWTRENNIKNLKHQLLDGNVLLFLKNLKQEAPEFFYSYVTNQLGLKHIRDIMAFAQCITQLH